MSKKLLLILASVALVSCGRDSTPLSAPVSSAKIQGDLIVPAATPPAPLLGEPEDEVKRKHPKPPSTQRRMVLAELVELGQTNAADTAMPSGTRGTAADFAKTNLPSITSLLGTEPSLPGYLNISFATLSAYDFNLTTGMADGTNPPGETATQAKAQIPANIQSLDGKRAVVCGFLLPVKMNNELAVEFLLLRNQSMCCYGVPPKINEWITVQMNGKGVKPVMDQPIAVAGTLHVGPIEENGCLAGIYRLDGEKVVTPF